MAIVSLTLDGDLDRRTYIYCHRRAVVLFVTRVTFVLGGNAGYDSGESLPSFVCNVLVGNRPVAGAIGRLGSPGRAPAIANDEVPTTRTAGRILIANQANRVSAH